MLKKISKNLLKRISVVISNNRNNVVFKTANKLCRKFIRSYENNNNDHFTNGESFLLSRLATNENWIFFDVGANIGKWTLLVRQFLPEAIIHSFEPIPNVYEELRNNCTTLSHVTCNCAGLSNVDGEIEFVQDLNNSLFSGSIKNQHHQSFQTIRCKVQTGDSYCAEKNIEQVHFLKIDVEGAEPKVLEGFRKMLSAGKIDMIQFEYSTINIETGYLLKYYYSLLEQYGYHIGKLYPRGVAFKKYEYSMEDFIGLNYIAVHKNKRTIIQNICL